jgi:rhodanese-related sulfurtransferase
MELDCNVCGDNATITSMLGSQVNLENSLSNNSKQSSLELDEIYRIQVSEYDEICKNNINHILLDVRNEIQYEMLSLQRYQQLYDEEVNQGHDVRYIKPVRNSCSLIINIPLSKLLNGQVLQTLIDSNNNNNNNNNNRSCINSNNNSNIEKLISLRYKVDLMKEEKNIFNFNENTNNSNFSELPIYVLCRRGIDSVSATQLLISQGFKNIYNINGGITAWKDEVDNSFPSY